MNSDIKQITAESQPEKMTLLSTILSFFPLFIIILGCSCLLWICTAPSFFNVLSLILTLYALPLLIYKIHNHFYPISEGISYLQGKAYSPWWGSYQIQVIYITFPILESLLRLIPGMFSLWLRLWGAKVGKGVYWTPHLEISDRGFLEIGDYVIFGHKVGIYSHVIKPRKDNLMLYVKKVHIGSHSFIGAGSYLATGVVITEGSLVNADSKLFPNQKY